MPPNRYHSSASKDVEGYLEWVARAKWSILAVIATFICTWTITSNTKMNINQLQLAHTAQVFRYNRTFAEGNAAADTAWQTIFPEQGGFFQHPDIAPKRSGFSVFHQLHCLDSIRKSYWINFEAARTPKAIDVDDAASGDMLSPAHIRHCIDMLRQSLMCNADLTVEPVDPKIKASTGWGISHQCKDYSQLMEFMKAWQERH